MSKMKIKREERLPVVVLHPGESIESSVSFELRIDGDQAWVSYRVRGVMQEGETAELLTDRIANAINHGIKKSVEDAVKLSREIGE